MTFFLNRFLRESPRGHFLSLYSALASRLGSNHIIGSVDAPREIAIPLLSPGLARPHLFVTLNHLSRRPLDLLNGWLQGLEFGKEIVCYEGALYDFWLFCHLARKNPKHHFAFNFHWPHVQLQAARSGRICSDWYKKKLSCWLQACPNNLVLFAESKQAAADMTREFCVSVREFPVPSNDGDFLERKKIEDRLWDVVVRPITEEELQWTAEFVDLVRVEEPHWKVLVLAPDGCKADFNADVLRGRQPTSVYRSVVVDTKRLVLPYTLPYYRLGSSGRVMDALSVGTVVTVPPQTSIAEMVQSTGQPLPKEFSPLSVLGFLKGLPLAEAAFSRKSIGHSLDEIHKAITTDQRKDRFENQVDHEETRKLKQIELVALSLIELLPRDYLRFAHHLGLSVLPDWLVEFVRKGSGRLRLARGE